MMEDLAVTMHGALEEPLSSDSVRRWASQLPGRESFLANRHEWVTVDDVAICDGPDDPEEHHVGFICPIERLHKNRIAVASTTLPWRGAHGLLGTRQVAPPSEDFWPDPQRHTVILGFVVTVRPDLRAQR